MFQFQYTLPGVTKNSRYWGTYELYAFGNINAVSINGGVNSENEVLVDGQATTRMNRSATFAPSLNAIEEVSVRTNNYDAQYGRMGGGTTSITLRTGTNSLHGQVFEYLKNDNLNANYSIANALGIKLAEFKNNTFGFSTDGPVYIPKVLDGRNKLFFLLSLEALRERNPQTQLWTVPTAAELQGNFSGLTDNQGRPILIYDPLTTQGTTRQPFAGNAIPSNRINPVASKVASFFPAPNRVSEGRDGQNNYLFVNSSRNSYDQWIGKMDWNVTQKHRLAWRYGQTPWANFARIQWGTNAAEPSSEHPSTRVSRNWGAEWTYVVSPAMVFNLRAGLARYEGFSGNTFGRDYDPRQLGFPDTLVRQFTGLQYPRFNFGDRNMTPLGATQTSGYEATDNYSLQPTLNLVRSRHSFKMGADLRRYNNNNMSPQSQSGNYTFNRNWTQENPQQANALAGSSFATFLLGYPSSGYVDRNISPAYRNHYWGFFFHDDWKVTSRLTLNLGLRWDYESPIVERYNRQVRGFAFDQASPIASRVQGLTLKGGLLYADGSNRQAFERDRNNWQPRVGVAWQFRDNWVMRAGYGLSYLGQAANGPNTGFSQQTALVASTNNNLTPAVNLSDPFPSTLFPNGLLQPIGSSQGLSTNLGQAVTAQYLDRPLPYSHQFSFGFQRTLPFGWLGDVSYVGNLTRKLPVNLALNRAPVEEINRLPIADRPAYFNAQVPNPMAGLLPGSGINGATIPRERTFFAYPHFSQVTISNVPIGQQTYHSLQLKGTRRLSAGLSAQFSYTWGKTLERAAALNAQDVVVNDLLASQLEQRLVEYDIPHTFVGVVTFELPFGKGRKLLANNGRVVDYVLGGWNMNVYYLWRSGQPIEFPNAAPLEARSAKLNDEQRLALAKQAGRDKFEPLYDRWFDTTLFPRTALTPFTMRNFPTRFPDVRSPRMTNWDISIYKEFRFTERVKFQLRADWNNAFNQPYYGRLTSRPNNVTDPRFGLLDPEPGNDKRVVVLIGKLVF